MELRKPEFEGANDMMSAADLDANGPALGASRVGAELRSARLRLGWSLPDVAQELRIRLPYLEAIEDGRLSDLPGNAYAVGFLRTYAAALGLDAAEVARRFRAEAQEVNRKPELSFPAPVPERGVPAGAVILLGVVLAAGAYAAWYRFSDDRRSDPGVAPIPERLAPLADRRNPARIHPVAASRLDPAATAPRPPPRPSRSRLPPPRPCRRPPPPPSPPPTPAPGSVLHAACRPLPGQSAAQHQDPNRLVLRFKSGAYVQVREKQGPGAAQSRHARRPTPGRCRTSSGLRR